MEVLAVLAIVVGTLSQRITGMGSALIIGPFLVLLFGPVDGVIVTVAACTLIALLVLFGTWRDISWRVVTTFTISALPGLAAGAWVASVAPNAQLQIAIGLMIIAALATSLMLERRSVLLKPTLPLGASAGFVSGAMNAIAGVGGPAVSAYAILTRMPHTVFVAVLQPYFLVIGLGTLVAKLAFSGGVWPQISPWLWLVIIVAVVVGHFGGTALAKRVPVPVARGVMIVLALAGGLAALVSGIALLVQ
ncbi:MAG: sulfite exporter TauE/SafE family protein [Agrococcus casei]|uniref:sulfite exporter TauE/SafE family protein n=1 Tax=Agrococcus casei TaxID=343512 RepID=UPI003F94FC4E